MTPEITVQQLAQRLKGGQPPLVVDVREPQEFAYCRIEGARLLPLGGIVEWSKNLDAEADIVLMCHTGQRSAYATQLLRRMGFKRVQNLRGGIEAWSVLVDPSVPRY